MSKLSKKNIVAIAIALILLLGTIASAFYSILI